ncbi:hypothetical protein ACJMK2_004559 [Sinanodonta woodiana]|uniref:sphinganine-1-phosphate aldolase n=1 Tax=Sinanodonta woodiana TaxID=1069815 RepID=A0ABD3Y2P2_SINWO
MFEFVEHFLFTLVVAILASVYFRKGRDELIRVLLTGLKALPGVQELLDIVLYKAVASFVKTTNLAEDTQVDKMQPRVVLSKEGTSHEELRRQMILMKKKETSHEEGKIFAYVYTLDDDHFQLQKDAFDLFNEKISYSVDHDTLVREFHHAFLHENALNPMIYPSLRKMETEIISMTAAMLNGSREAVGFLTSGGTESNMMAVKTYRDRARKLWPHIKKPNIVTPITIHPTIDKAAHYFGLEVIHTPIGPDFRADVSALAKAINSNTIMIAASAPQFCHGVVDPIGEISDIALRRGLPFHVDACFGGFMLPWVEKLGYPVPPFDFRCQGVTSVSADIHKYGYGTKGSSVIVYRNSEIRKFQIYTYAQWPGGLYGSPSMAGTRPGGNIAASWASMKALGEDGYLRKAKELMETTIKLKAGIQNIQGLCILGEPHMTAFAIGSSDPDINMQAVADVMEQRGWKMERNMNPDSIHCSILPHHVGVVDELLAVLKSSAQEVKENKSLAKKGTAAMYGMMATIPDKAIINDFITEFFSEIYKCK